MREDFSYFQDHEFISALEAYERMLDHGAEADLDPETLTDIAEYYVINHREKEAYRCIDYAQSFYPDSVDPQIFLARQQMFTDHQEEAWKICNQILDQNDREVIFLRAELLLRDDKVDEAFKLLLGQYTTMDCEDAADFLYDSISLIMDYDFNDVAYDWCLRLREEHPDYLSAIPLLAEIFNYNKQYKDAIKILNDNLADLAYDSQTWRQMAEAQLSLGNLTEAYEATEYMLAINKDDADALLLRGSVLFDLDEPEEAHQCYLQFLHFYPQEARAVYMDAQCLFVMERFDEAVTQFERLTNIDDEVFRGYTRSYLAYCHYKLKNRDRMLHYLRLASKERHECLKELFEGVFPDINPKDYYQEALKLE